MSAARRFAHALGVAWSAGCAAFLTILIATRWIRYATWSATPAIDAVVRRVMVIDTQTFLWLWGYAQVELPTIMLAAAVAALALHRRLPGMVATREGGRFALTP